MQVLYGLIRLLKKRTENSDSKYCWGNTTYEVSAAALSPQDTPLASENTPPETVPRMAESQPRRVSREVAALNGTAVIGNNDLSTMNA